MSTYFDLIMIPLQLLIVFFTIYYFTLSFFGLFGRRPEEKIYDEQKTFAMIVCAHNEEQVIGQLVENLHLLNYSDQLYDIFVVADNVKTIQRKLPVKQEQSFMNALMIMKKAKDLQWIGCSKGFLKWNVNMMLFVSLMQII